ncbi:hypothetical protein B0T10DRAFT_576010 [Thelonectria olida]|uniref:PNPLA domain-containing protein n=1 Tax=Thelonectria olida TaxID=1576542 RepID=A0A9P8VZS2_9HYPO|nr:hypothetical protein B0T10DRAFT_576010 [Thelonectria olida]
MVSAMRYSDSDERPPLPPKPILQPNFSEFDMAAACDDSFCDECWPKQRPHLPGKIGIDGRQHEKVDAEVNNRLSKIFGQPTQEEQNNRHGGDISTTWFGVVNEGYQPFLHYSNRMVDILQESQVGDYSERFPHLVSFVGQTGAGKSTIIKMLINREQARTVQARAKNTNDYPAPVPGLVGDNIPTTGDVHLYADPGTYYAQKPILYADCEGLTGGENAPRSLTCREKIEGKKPKHPARNKLRKRLAWADNPKLQSREYAVKTLFPRILYTFSDVVVFILREVRTFQTEVLQQLICWAAMSIDKSINQPSLPHIVVVINATETSIDDAQWDPDAATKGLLGDYENSVHQVPALREVLARLEQGLGKRIETTHDLLLHYYSSVKVVRIPWKGRYMQIDDQVGKLYDVISSRCAKSYAYKEKIRMSLNAERLPQYVTAAYDHFSRQLDEPFDFAKEARRHTPLPKDFRGHILNLILSMYNRNDGGKIRAEIFFETLSLPVASCIMLAATRDNIQGTYSSLLKNTYHEPLKAAFTEFCDRWLRCSFEKAGYQCCNAQNTHGKGHQAHTGRILAKGTYQSTFDTDKFFADWIKSIDQNIQVQDDLLQRQVTRDERTLPAKHKRIMAEFYRANGPADRIKSHLTCLCCVRNIPGNVLPCQHALCKDCVQAFGWNVGKGVFELHDCPLHPLDTRWASPARIRFKPHGAGVRVLCLDGGGVRGIIELMILQAIEKKLGGYIPIQSFFDLIVGTSHSTGGIIALGLGVKQWSVDDCILRFENLCKDAFTSRGPPALRALTIVSRISLYKTKPLEDALQSAFGTHGSLYGNFRSESSMDIRVAVTSTHATEKRPVVLSNYNTQGRRDGLPYAFVRSQDPDRELKIWEAARATAAAPPYFKPFLQKDTMAAYTDGAIHHNCPASIADYERRLLWEEVSDWPPDIMLSLGTGLGNPGKLSPDAQVSSRSKSPRSPRLPGMGGNGLKMMWWAANAIVDNQLDCEGIWKKHCAKATPPGQTHTVEDMRRNLRINIQFPESRPILDDVKALDSMQRHAENSILEDADVCGDIHEVAHRLIASCFYFEESGPGILDRATGVYRCDGHIRCRFSEGSSNLKGVGRFLRNCIRGQSLEPYFFLQENYGTPEERVHEVPIAPSNINNMCNLGIFQLSTELKIEAAHQSSTTRLSLRLQEDPYRSSSMYSSVQDPSMGSLLSISGFPRKIWARGVMAVTPDKEEPNGEEEVLPKAVGEPVPEMLVEEAAALRGKKMRLFGPFSRSRRKSPLPAGDPGSPSSDGKLHKTRDSIGNRPAELRSSSSQSTFSSGETRGSIASTDSDTSGIVASNGTYQLE